MKNSAVACWLLVIGTCVSFQTFGQANSDFKFDDNLTITLPSNYQAKDTLGQKIVKAQVDNGLIVVTRIPLPSDNPVNVKTEDNLIEFYKGVQQGTLNSAKGELLEESITKVDQLTLKRFSYLFTMAEEKRLGDCLLLSIDGNVYEIQFWQLASMADDMKKQREALFSSIKLNPKLTLQNQLQEPMEASTAYKTGNLIGQLLIPAAFIFLIFYLVRRNKRRKAELAKGKV